MSPPSLRDTNRATTACVTAGVVALAAYSFGLSGPFILDDHVNLAPIWQWLSGQRDAWSAVVDNRSGPAGRPLAYLSFLANAAVGGDSPLGFKLVNLALHLFGSWLVLMWMREMLGPTGVAPRGPLPAWIPIALASLWLLHPQHVSSVLYVVQRMALLGAIAQLTAVLIYFEARRLADSAPKRSQRLLFVAFPAVVALGMLAKETAALAPLLCAVVEFTLFAGTRRPRSVQLFFVLFLALPLLAGFALLTIDPDRILAPYAGREFTLVERLLTQPRVLLDYALKWFWPAHLALYRDGFPLTNSLWQPPMTAVAVAFWLALATAGIALRRRAPLFAFGVLWFLAGHALEAGPIALEVYFEHRNYLPSLGLVIAAFALARPLIARMRRSHVRSFVLVSCALLAALTAVRSRHWADADGLMAHEGPPTGEVSRRLQIDRTIRAVERGDTRAQHASLAVLEGGSAGNRAAASLWRAILACDQQGRVGDAMLEALRRTPTPVLTHSHLSWLGLLARRAVDGRCPGLSPKEMSAILAHWKLAARQPLSAHATRELGALEAQLAPEVIP